MCSTQTNYLTARPCLFDAIIIIQQSIMGDEVQKERVLLVGTINTFSLVSSLIKVSFCTLQMTVKHVNRICIRCTRFVFNVMF